MQCKFEHVLGSNTGVRMVVVIYTIAEVNSQLHGYIIHENSTGIEASAHQLNQAPKVEVPTCTNLPLQAGRYMVYA